jgi:hypothetical protein
MAFAKCQRWTIGEEDHMYLTVCIAKHLGLLIDSVWVNQIFIIVFNV